MTVPTGTVPPALLTLEQIHVRLGGRDVLRDVSVTLRPGEFTGLIGPNGAGKTTLLRVILGLQAPTSGRVLADRTAGDRPAGDGQDTREGPGRGGGRRRGPAVGYVPQKFLIDPDMPLRVRDVVALGLDGHKLGIRFPSRARRELVGQTLAAVGAARFADARIGELSGGEQQRVLIAHALISRPGLLLLDEPLANLDIASAQGIVALLARLVRTRRISVLMSAHDMNPLLGVMDRIIYVAGGRAAAGRTDEVVRQEVLCGLYGHHVDVIRVHGRVLVVAGAGEDTGAEEDTGPARGRPETAAAAADGGVG